MYLLELFSSNCLIHGGIFWYLIKVINKYSFWTFLYRLIIKITNYSYIIREIVQLPFKWYITINGQSIKTDVVDRTKTDVVGKMWYVIWGVPMETNVLTSSSSIFDLLTYFSSSRRETLVNKTIQVIEAFGRGYIVGILIQLTITGFAWFTAFKYMFCSIWGIINVSIAKVTFVIGSLCLTYMKKWYCLCFYVTWFKSYGTY